jgi:hypothetical protein
LKGKEEIETECDSAFSRTVQAQLEWLANLDWLAFSGVFLEKLKLQKQGQPIAKRSVITT